MVRSIHLRTTKQEARHPGHDHELVKTGSLKILRLSELELNSNVSDLQPGQSTF